LFDARRKVAAWQKEYNEERPHSSLGYRTPKEFATAMRAAEAGCALPASPPSAAKPGGTSSRCHGSNLTTSIKLALEFFQKLQAK